jgi:hypothetical protein
LSTFLGGIAAMKVARGDRTAKWLSDRTDELGYRVSPTVIAKLDSGHRGDVLSVAELLIIAAALDVPPVAVLFPDLPTVKWKFCQDNTFRRWRRSCESPGSEIPNLNQT